MIKKFLALRKEKVTKVAFTAKADAGELELLVYDIIGEDFFGEGISAGNFKQAIADAGEFKSITMRINSPGGDAFEGAAIYNMLRATGKPIKVYVDGVAASAASIVAMAGDERVMGEGSMIMVHNAMALAFGNAAEMREMADVLDNVSGSLAEIYVARVGMDKTGVKKLMDAETWMGAEEAIEKGFATSQVKTKAKATAAFDFSVYNNVPDSLKACVDVSDEEKKKDDVTAPATEFVEDPTISVMRKRIEIIRARS
jgi:ATP-dependent Clp protease, protease subunit